MRWPWTRPDDEVQEGIKETEYTRGRLHQAVSEFERALDSIETRVKEVSQDDKGSK